VLTQHNTLKSRGFGFKEEYENFKILCGYKHTNNPRKVGSVMKKQVRMFLIVAAVAAVCFVVSSSSAEAAGKMGKKGPSVSPPRGGAHHGGAPCAPPLIIHRPPQQPPHYSGRPAPPMVQRPPQNGGARHGGAPCAPPPAIHRSPQTPHYSGRPAAPSVYKGPSCGPGKQVTTRHGYQNVQPNRQFHGPGPESRFCQPPRGGQQPLIKRPDGRYHGSVGFPGRGATYDFGSSSRYRGSSRESCFSKGFPGDRHGYAGFQKRKGEEGHGRYGEPFGRHTGVGDFLKRHYQSGSKCGDGREKHSGIRRHGEESHGSVKGFLNRWCREGRQGDHSPKITRHEGKSHKKGRQKECGEDDGQGKHKKHYSRDVGAFLDRWHRGERKGKDHDRFVCQHKGKSHRGRSECVEEDSRQDKHRRHRGDDSHRGHRGEEGQTGAIVTDQQQQEQQVEQQQFGSTISVVQTGAAIPAAATSSVGGESQQQQQVGGTGVGQNAVQSGFGSPFVGAGCSYPSGYESGYGCQQQPAYCPPAATVETPYYPQYATQEHVVYPEEPAYVLSPPVRVATAPAPRERREEIVEETPPPDCGCERLSAYPNGLFVKIKNSLRRGVCKGFILDEEIQITEEWISVKVEFLELRGCVYDGYVSREMPKIHIPLCGKSVNGLNKKVWKEILKKDHPVMFEIEKQ